MLLGIVFVNYSCSDNDNDTIVTHNVVLQLIYPDSFEAQEGVTVNLDKGGVKYSGKTDATGKTSISVESGVYTASVTDSRTVDGKAYSLNSSKTVTVGDDWNQQTIVNLDLTSSITGGLVIKEMYIGGCPKDDGSGAFMYDQYVILYNNSDQEIDLSNVSLGMVSPYNAHGSNKDYDTSGKLSYESEGWIPAGMGFWYFQNSPKLAAGSQIVIALNNAIDNTSIYSKSINFANSGYYCTYDQEQGFTHKLYYTTPSSAIPTNHYLKAERFSVGLGWVLSQLSPAFFIFIPEKTTLKAFTADPSTSTSESLVRKKVPANWIVDGVEVFKSGDTNNKKRLTAAIDAGYINFVNQQGYSLYRNVNKDQTEAIADNKGKLVYNYSMGTTDSTDPSGIDAEASIKNGARIVYKDTNNSTQDFHQRKEASLRNN